MKLPHKIIIGASIIGISAIGVQSLQPHRFGPIDIYPNSTITPGVINPDVTQSNIMQTICVSGWTATIRPPASYTTALKIKQLAQMGNIKPDQVDGHGKSLCIEGTSNTACYEEDHFISLELGGNPTDPNNLWPEPYTASIPNGGAKSKDSVENNLRKAVCGGTMTLVQAQTIISTDWYSYYKHQSPSFGAIELNGDLDDN